MMSLVLFLVFLSGAAVGIAATSVAERTLRLRIMSEAVRHD